MGKPYAIIEYEGQPARLYADRAIRNDKGQMLTRLPGAAEGLRDKAGKVLGVEGRDLANLSQGDLLAGLKAEKATSLKRLAEAESQAGMLRAVKQTVAGKKLGTSTPVEAWGVVVESQTVLAMAGGRESTGAARLVGETTGYHRKESSGGGGAVQVNVMIGGELAARYGAEPGEVDIIDVDEGGFTVPGSDD